MSFLRSRRWLLLAALVLSVLFVGAAYKGYKKFSQSRKPGNAAVAPVAARKPNIILISMCSLSGPMLNLIGGPSSPAHGNLRFKSRFYNIMRGAYRFDNYATRHPWINVTRYSVDSVSPALLREYGYDYYFAPGQSLVYRVPQRAITLGKGADRGYEGDLVLNYKEEEAGIREKVVSQLKEPFVLMMHHKYMHYPFYDSVNPNFTKFLTPDKKIRARLEELKARKTISDAEEIPLAVLFNRARSEKISPVVLLLMKEKYKTWKKSPNYELDLRAIGAAYRAKWENFMFDLQHLLITYSVGHLLDNTIIIFDGDHGEAFMQHGELSHANQLYEESIVSPLWIRFPPYKPFNPIKPVNTQIDKETATSLFLALIKGEVNEGNMEDWVRRHEVPDLVSRSCSGMNYSVRTKDRWKLIVNMETNERELYDLNQDPGEQSNLAEKEPGKVEDLYEKILLGRPAVDAVVDRDTSACNPAFDATDVNSLGKIGSSKDGRNNNYGARESD